MKIVVIGASGTIGKAIVEALSAGNEVIAISRTSGDRQADITDAASLDTALASVAPFDALISAAGGAAFKPVTELTDEDLAFSLGYKLMGQINVIRTGLKYVTEGGSITVSSGVLAQEPSPGSAAVSLVNSGLEGFVRAAGLERPRNVRVNVVSPPWVTETLKAYGMPLDGGMDASAVARSYVAAVDGSMSGQVLDARTF